MGEGSPRDRPRMAIYLTSEACRMSEAEWTVLILLIVVLTAWACDDSTDLF
jgi:hypothetical protein